MIEKQNISKGSVYIILFVIAFAVVFASTFNPFNFIRMHVDSSVYITIAQGITKGQLPYKNFVDNKCPLTYLFSVPGLLLGGFTGVWLTELIFLFITALFAFKTALFFTTRNKALFVTAISFIALLSFFFVNAGTEEYSLPFLMISLYIFTKYYFSAERNVSFVELVVLGICFACAIMIRLNMFPLWASFCFVIVVEAIIKRCFALLGKYVIGFCLGIVIVFVPVFLYLKVNGILDDFFIQVIFNGAARGFSRNIKDIVKNYFISINNGYSFLPLFLGLYWMIINSKKSYFAFYAGYTFSCFMMILFFSLLSGDPHYNLVLIPFFIPAFAFLVEVLYNSFSRLYTKILSFIFLVVFFCFIFSEGLTNYLWDFSRIFNGNLKDTTWTELIKVGKMIDENTKPGDKIISLGYNAYIYLFTQRASVSKYFYQGYWIRSIPGARETFISDVLQGKPSVIAFFDGPGEIDDYWHAPILELMEKEYRLLSDENGFKLFIKNK